MAKAGDVLDMAQLGCRVALIRTGEETDGELIEFDVLGRPRGLLVQPHVHLGQVEHYEVIAGGLKLVEGGREHVLGPGETMQTPAGTAHRQMPADGGDGHVRVQVRPAGTTQAFLERLADMCAAGDINRFGLPRPVAAARMVADFGDEGHAARPWDVAAPREAVFAAISDGRTYPLWWRPVYLDVEADGPAELGKEARQHFKGRLPYHLHTRSRVVELDAPRLVTAEVDGDLRGRGTWTLTATASGTHVRFDWQVHADRKLLRALTPVLRPLFRWNHNWAIARAMEGLEPYAQRTA